MIRDNDVYRIGKIGKPHGIKGEVQMQIDDDVFDRVDADYLVLRIDGIMVPFFMEEYRFRSNDSVLMKFIGVDTQERARELTGTEVFFPNALADDDEEGEVSTARIVGFTIVNSADGKEAGKIAGVDDSTVNTLFELENGVLIPATADMIVEIDTNNRIITMDLPDGILDL